jgi:hypothetical protein
MSVQLMNPDRAALDRAFRATGHRPIALALISDLNAIAEAGCPACEQRGTTEVVPYQGDGWRLLCTCECGFSWEA